MKKKMIILMFCLFSVPISAESVIPSPPAIKASSYLVVDFTSGRYLVEHNIDERVEPASLTKIMTAYVVEKELADGNITLEDSVRVSEKAWRMEGSRMFIEVGKTVSVADLLKGVIIQSGNDASVALAEHVSGDEGVFASIMNQHAARLGMSGTHFVNSTGLPAANHYTTARDMAILSMALIREFPEPYKLHAKKEFTFNNIKQNNRNNLLWKDGSVDGIKTGHTEAAGYCLVASAIRNDMRLISVVMGTTGNNARTQASQSLLNYAFRYYENRKLFSAGEVITSSQLWKGELPTFPLGLTEDLIVTIPRGKYKEVQTTAAIQDKVIAPVNKNTRYGEFKVSLYGEQIAAKPLVALDSVAEGSFISRMLDEVKLLFD